MVINFERCSFFAAELPTDSSTMSMSGSGSRQQERRRPHPQSGGSNSTPSSNTRRKLNSDERLLSPTPSISSNARKGPADIADVLGLNTSFHQKNTVRSPVVPLEVTSTAASSHHMMETNAGSTIPSAINYFSNPPLLLNIDATDHYLNKEAISIVVTDRFFPEVKFVNKQFEMAWDDDPNSFCQFFISNLHVPVEVGHKSWWAAASRIVSAVLCQTRNDRITAVKFAFVGTCNVASPWNCCSFI